MAVDSRPRVLCVMDQAGWCFESHARQLTRYLADEFQIERLLTQSVLEQPELTADVLIAFNWPSLARIPRGRFGRVVACLCDHWSVAAYRSPRFFELIRETADAVTVVNQDLQRQIVPYLDVPVFVLEPGVDCEQFQPLPFPKRLTFGWCGNSAFAPDWAQIQDGKGLELIRQAARQAGAFVKIVDSGQGSTIPKSQMASEFYREISVYVVASVSEGTPNPLLEALACGRPVITTDVGLVPRSIQQGVNGLIIPRDVDRLAAAMRRFLSQELQPEQMAAACRRSALLHDWSLKCIPWRHCLKSLIQNC